MTDRTLDEAMGMDIASELRERVSALTAPTDTTHGDQPAEPPREGAN